MILLRHASAGDSATWEGPDRDRPLDRKGERQARELIDLLARFPVSAIYTSPALRCVETIRPLAESRGLAFVVRGELGEDRYWSEGAGVVEELSGGDALLCSHGGLESALVDPPKLHKAEAFVVDDALRIVETLRP
jgi:8-oxo-dGTP diphosphatase